MDENDIEVLPDGRIVLVLHSGWAERPMSTHEVKVAFLRKFSNPLMQKQAKAVAVCARTAVLE